MVPRYAVGNLFWGADLEISSPPTQPAHGAGEIPCFLVDYVGNKLVTVTLNISFPHAWLGAHQHRQHTAENGRTIDNFIGENEPLY